MKKIIILALLAVVSTVTRADVTAVFTNAAAALLFDGSTQVDVPLNDSGIDFTMTVLGTGGDLNSNATGMGIVDAAIDGTAESITIWFNTGIYLTSVNLGVVGGDISDGAHLTIAGSSVDLYTGVSGFNGTSDIYTLPSPAFISAGQTIIMTGSSVTSSFELEEITFYAVPEPATLAMLGFGSLAALAVRRISIA